MTQQELFYRFAAALATGILVGLERERAHRQEKRKAFAGMRTFALIGFLGSGAAFVSDLMGEPWAFVFLGLGLGVLMTVGYYFAAKEGLVGITTEVAALLVYLIGALCFEGELTLAAAMSVAMTALLAFKTEMHRFAFNLTREDVYATLTFAVISAIILPVLPNEPIGPPPFDVLNPYNVWLMVVFISGISFLGYVLIKIVGPRMGVVLTGLLGGLASSTAVTLSLTERSRKREQLGRSLALAIMLAWTVMFGRVVVAVGVVNPALTRHLVIPMGAAMLVGLAYCGYLYRARKPEKEKEGLSFSNPFELGPALRFGLIYALVLLLARVAQTYLGEAGVYLSSAVAGLADADAIALTVAELNTLADGPSAATATQAIVLAAMANTLAKGTIVILGGAATVRKALVPGVLLMLGTGLGVAFLLS